ncbi:hypothetical protein V1504DRAFT_497602 [Lipomyces starkeyi]
MDDDINIKITHCGVCASDIHTLRSGSGETDYPIVVGHEIVGNVVRKGKNVVDLEMVTSLIVRIMSGHMACASPMVPYGGYAEYGRYPASFAFKLPESIPSEIAAPMLCGGLTRYGAGPEKTIGIVGIGVLGHFGILFASALGATKIYAISRTRGKEADFRAMGATDFIATAEPGWVENNLRSIDLIVCTANDTSIPMSDYLRLLKFGGTLVQVGVPEGGLPKFDLSPLMFNNVHLTGTVIGGRQEMKDILEMAATKKVNSWIETKPISNVNEVVQLMRMETRNIDMSLLTIVANVVVE